MYILFAFSGKKRYNIFREVILLNYDLIKAKDLLGESKLTLAAVRNDDVITSSERGVKPLLALMDSGKGLSGYSAADKVVGMAAAYLYVLLDVKELYAGVISRKALSVLEKYRIPAEYGVLTDAVINRSGTGLCPMETAVLSAESPENALMLIRARLGELSEK